jgi:hypothetical protein
MPAPLPLPKLPTDNLYKFVALGGLFLVGLGVYVHYREADFLLEKWAPIVKRNSSQDRRKTQLQQKSAEIAASSAELTKQAAEWDRRWAAFLQNKDRQSEESKAQTIRDHEFAHEIQIAAEETKSDSKKVLEEIQELGNAITETNALSEEYRTFDVASSRLNWFSMASIVLGLICAGWGFWRWYFRIQIFQDRVLAAEAAAVTTTAKA